MSENEFKLNFPYYVYPGIPGVHGYYDTVTYNKELIRLYNFINTQISQINCPTLLHITIGTAAEEIYNKNVNTLNEYDFQYQQLYPEHLLREYILTNNNILHLIITPNDIKTPRFIQMTPEMQWKMDENNVFVDKTSRYKVMIFNTMMPTCDQKNKRIVEHYSNSGLGKYFDINIIKQTNNDIEFVNNFYSKLGNLFDAINQKSGRITCFSFAVFNENTDRACVKNYMMFKEITSLFTHILLHDDNTRILAEWRYILSSYTVIRYKTNKHIRYVINNGKMNDGITI